MRLAVVGSGVSGLAAGLELRRLAAASGTELELAVFEATSLPGGKVGTVPFHGTKVDVGAESILVRDPAVEAIVDRLGLTERTVSANSSQASIWRNGHMVKIPRETVLGVPLHPLHRDVVGVLGPWGSARAALEPLILRRDEDPDQAIGSFLARRVGSAVSDRLVDPLLGGVYAGGSASLSVGAVAPQLLGAVRNGSSLLRGLRRAARSKTEAGPSPSPFISFDGGLATLVERMVGQLPDGAIRFGTRVVQAAPDGERLGLEGAPEGSWDGVVLAVPAFEAAGILGETIGGLGASLRQLRYSSVATVTLAYATTALTRPLSGSGFLVARSPRRVVTACTFLDRKWPHLAQADVALLRASVGSLGDDWALELNDASLVASVHADLRRMLALRMAPVDAVVRRWPQALPQYAAGHLAWNRRVTQGLRDSGLPISLAGAAYNGIGVAACLKDGTRAAQDLWTRLGAAVEPAPATIES